MAMTQPDLTMLPLRRFARRGLAGLATAVGGAVALAILVSALHAAWPPLARADRRLASALTDTVGGWPMGDTGQTAITNLGGNAVVWWLVTVTALGMAIRHQVGIAAFLVVSGVGALALAPTVTFLVDRLRPILPESGAPGATFPSGHALNAAVVYGAVLLVFLPVVPRRLRGAAVAVAVVLVVAVGVSRMALGVGYASDVVAGWLAGAAWLGLATLAFRRTRAEAGRPPRPITEGLVPEAAPSLAPTGIVPVRHPWRAVGVLGVGWLAVLGILIGVGTLITRDPPAFDAAVPDWLADRRVPELDQVSYVWSWIGSTHGILAVGLVIGPLAIACVRRWRPAVFLAVLMFGELGLFLAAGAVVDRDRPQVSQLDGALPTSSFPSGHVAATACLYGAAVVLLFPRTRRWWRWLPVGLAAVALAAVALSRMYRGVHHPLDVAGGTLLALLWLAVVVYAIQPNIDLAEARRGADAPLAPATASIPIVVPPASGNRSAVVANPTKLGDELGRRTQIAAALARAGWPEPLWLSTTPEAPGAHQARQAVDRGVDVVFAAGGDGTVRACVDGLVGTPVALAILPFGTGNLLARNLRLPSRVPEAVAVVTANRRRPVDVGVTEGRCFTVMAGMGFDAQMLHDAPDRLKARIGWFAYALAALRHLSEPPMTVDIGLDHQTPIRRLARCVLIGNVGRLPGGLRLMPDANPYDGLLDVAVLMPPRPRSWLPLAWAMARRRRTAPTLETFQAAHIEVTSDQSQPRELDGDLIEPSPTLTATVRPSALWLCTAPTPARDGRTAGPSIPTPMA